MICFNIFGINFSISVGFFGILTLMLYIDKTGLMLPTMLAIVLHEAGHIIALSLFKSKPERIILRVGTLRISGRFLLTKKKEIVMLLAGPLLNLFLFSALLCLYFILGNFYVLNFALVMLVVGGFNLLPIIGLDGGGIIEIIFNSFLKQKAVKLLSIFISFITIFSILVLGLFVFLDTKSNISLILMGIYLFLGILLSKKQKNYCKLF